MLEIYNNTRTPTAQFLRFQISMDTVTKLQFGQGPRIFESTIIDKHGYLTFQQPDDVAEAIRLFSPVALWPEVATRMGLTAENVKTRLSLIIDRRNQIAHEADLDPSFPGILWPISMPDVTSSIDFIERVCESIQNIVV
jgi:hypothetical protein